VFEVFWAGRSLPEAFSLRRFGKKAKKQKTRGKKQEARVMQGMELQNLGKTESNWGQEGYPKEG